MQDHAQNMELFDLDLRVGQLGLKWGDDGEKASFVCSIETICEGSEQKCRQGGT